MTKICNKWENDKKLQALSTQEKIIKNRQKNHQKMTKIRNKWENNDQNPQKTAKLEKIIKVHYLHPKFINMT